MRLLLCLWSAALCVAAEITYTQIPVAHQVLQRGADGAAAVVLAGAANVAGVLEGRTGKGSFSKLGDIAVGEWKAQGPQVKTGGPYVLELRFKPAVGKVLVERVKNIFVGDIWILSGQSNMVGRALMEGAEGPDPKVKAFTMEGKWGEAKEPLHEFSKGVAGVARGTGLGLPFAKEMVRRTGVPIGLVPCAKGGTSLAQWDPALVSEGRKSLYGNMLARFRDAGGRVTGVLWYQGESDAPLNTAGMYGEKFQAFVAKVRADFGQADLPFYYAQIGRYAAEMEPAYEGWNQVQEAQRLSEGAIKNSGMIATIDSEMADQIHANRLALRRLGLRFAKLVLDGARPRFVGASWDDPYHLRLKFSGVAGALSAGGGRVLGFSLHDETLKERRLIYRSAIDASNNSVVIEVIGAKALPAELYLGYGMGLDPVCNLVDGADMAVPVFGLVKLPRRP